MSTQSPIRVVAVEDDPGFRRTLETLMGHAPGFELCGSYGSAEAALAEATRRATDERIEGWDLVLMDISLGGMSGIRATEQLRELDRELPIVVLTVFEEPSVIVEAIAAGANGYLLKKTHARELLFQLRSVVDGGAPLTPAVASTVLGLLRTGSTAAVGSPPTRLNLTEREQQVLRCLVDGRKYKEAAEQLGIGIETVRSHVRAVYGKLQVHSVAAAVREAIRRGLV
ncbi:MAG: response regulator transcription factor [Acidobacteriota bacterium]|nr:response regulator transcription factor [Acidobacteriota bacterium]MDH3785600.1 response regulator transcription factor [Acidobacteriota bacterium]